MVGWTTKLWKIIDHWPFVTAALVVFCSLFLGGCLETRITSPYTGEQVTESQLQQEVDAERQKIYDEAATYEVSITNSVKALEKLTVKDETVIAKGQEALTALQEKRERNKNLITSLFGLIPPGPWSDSIPMLQNLLLGGLGLDTVRKSLVIRKMKNGSTPA